MPEYTLSYYNRDTQFAPGAKSGADTATHLKHSFDAPDDDSAHEHVRKFVSGKSHVPISLYKKIDLKG
jgi:hypothetical protein